MRTVETPDIREALIAELAYSAIPIAIMGLTLVGICLFGWLQTGLIPLLLSAIVGGAATGAKLILLCAHRARNRSTQKSLGEIGRWEAAHGATTFLVAASVGGATFTQLSWPDLHLHLLATGLLFGYCAGVASRIAIRPQIPCVALLLAAGPAILAAFAWSDVSRSAASVRSLYAIHAPFSRGS